MLEKINSPEDLKSLSMKELRILTREIREFLLEKVSRSGGHLASNLGVVELTIALHKFLDCPKDSLIWDVGHQCYVHKILTGRKSGFESLREKDGMSGFPDPKESEFDLFKTGHASTSISAAMGIAETNRKMKNGKKTVAVIGDGSFTGGLALEAINQIGYLQTPMVIVMNDNKMSIAENVGALSSYTKRIEKTEIYQEVKSGIDQLIEICPENEQKRMENLRTLRKSLKKAGTPGLLFEKLGVHYIGPVDGHNVQEVEKSLIKAFEYEGPVLIHARTKKGMGYRLAEDGAERFHGVSPFTLENGNSCSVKNGISATEVFGDKILQLARKDSKIIGVTAAMPSGTGLNRLANELPSQFYDVGIAEGHAVTFAAGMARNGFSPVVAIYSSFFQRALDQVIHDVCLQKLPVVFALDRAGLVGEDGPTHHGVFDISFLRFIPNLVLMAPSSEKELEEMLGKAVNFNKPTVIRYPRGTFDKLDDEKEKELSKKLTSIKLGKGVCLKEGNDCLVVFYGNQKKKAFEIAGKEKDCAVFDARFVKPLDENILKRIKKAKKVCIVEENVKMGGFGSAVLEAMNRENIQKKVQLIAVKDEFIEHGSVDELKEEYIL